MSTKKTKTAVIYDKWLDSFGGGEMVAFYMAKFLSEASYEVTIICRKKVTLAEVKNKFNINLKNIQFIELWNDENKLKQITSGKDLFINISFIDYLVGSAKNNIYYAHFPTKIYTGVKGYIFNQLVLPFIAKHIKPIEFIHPPKNSSTFNGKIIYELNDHTSIAYSYLDKNRRYNLKFFIYHQSISKSSLESFNYQVSNAKVISQTVYLDHAHNVLKYQLKLTPTNSTILLNLSVDKSTTPIFLIEPQLHLNPRPAFLTKILEQKLYSRVRAGLFSNVKTRLDQYKKIIVHSNYVASWVKKYWQRQAIVLYPPVEMLFKSNPINYTTKKNYIFSMGRFFTLGHSKKQDVMIKAFKQMCDSGLKNWELHLAGGLGNEPTSVDYYNQLKKDSTGYPIFFHINEPRSVIVKLFIDSKIYWHAAGFGENKNKDPINFEHFGITAVEAISAGCTPVLFNGGGLPEIIQKLKLDPKLYLFDSIEGLAQKTLIIISQDKLLQYNSKLLDKHFGVDSFKSNFFKIINS